MKISPKHIIPNALTLANVTCGFISLIYSSEGDLIWASLFIGFGALVDFMDGFSARLLNASTEFGKQLDSLSDMVTFGIAPAFLYYQFNNQIGTDWINMVSVLIALGAAIRLARFNIDTRQSNGFIGLPTPAFAILTSSLPLIYEFDSLGVEHLFVNPVFQMLYPIFGFILMVSGLRLFALKFTDFSFRKNKVRYAFLIISIVLLAMFQFMGIPMIILAYLLLSLIHNFAQ